MQTQDHDPASGELRAIGERLDALRSGFESVLGTLTTELAIKNAQTEVLTQLLRQQTLALCWLESIARQTCSSLNEAHIQTELQRSITDALQSLLRLYESVHPDAVLELTRLRELTARIEECCPPEPPKPICEIKPCLYDVPPASASAPSRHVVIDTRRVEGAPFPPHAIVGEALESRNEDRVPRAPPGPLRGSLAPTMAEMRLRRLTADPGEASKLGGAGDPVIFDRDDPFGNRVTFSGVPPDMSGAMHDNVVLMTGNTFAALSTNGGATFTALDPTTIFPSAPNVDAAGNFLDNGLCCDQVIQYAPGIDRFIWLMQFCGSAAATGGNCLQGINRLRIAYASPRDVVDSGGTLWTYFDVTSGQFNLGNTTMDYPDMSVGTDFLYVSADSVGQGLLVFRVPLAQLQSAAGRVDINFTTPADSSLAYGGHISQNTGDEVFWAGHVTTSRMRVFNWHQSSGQYSWRDIDILSWMNTDYTSQCTDNTDWLNFLAGFPGDGVIGATRRFGGMFYGGPASEVYFAWTAGRGGGFAHPYVRGVQIDTSNWTVTNEWQIWNPDHAFAYPCLATNSDQEVGLSLGWGGGKKFYANHAVGILGDFVVWYSELSDAAINRWGDYVTVRQASPRSKLFAGVGYSVLANTPPATGTRFNPRYVLFGRESAFAPPPVIR